MWDAPIRYPLRVEVDGEAFMVKQDPQQEGVYHYHWVSGPNTDYGFTSGIKVFDDLWDRISHENQPTLAEHVEGIRGFLEQVDPVTGYVEDD